MNYRQHEAIRFEKLLLLVSKIKPCMSEEKQLCTVKLQTAHYISNYLFDSFFLYGRMYL